MGKFVKDGSIYSIAVFILIWLIESFNSGCDAIDPNGNYVPCLLWISPLTQIILAILIGFAIAYFKNTVMKR